VPITIIKIRNDEGLFLVSDREKAAESYMKNAFTKIRN
jgi:hypothetical protein